MDSQRDPEREAPSGPDCPADYALFKGLISFSNVTAIDSVRWHEECGLSREAFGRIATSLGFRYVAWNDTWFSP